MGLSFNLDNQETGGEMLTILATVVVGLAIFWVVIRKYDVDPIGALMFIIVAVFLSAVVASKVGKTFPQEMIVRETKPLHNLYEETTVSGGFFLGSGSIDETEYLFYNTVTENGMIHPEKVDKYVNIYIVEGPGQPRLEIVEYVPSGKGAWWVIGGYNAYIFYIPEGSVDPGYRVK